MKKKQRTTFDKPLLFVILGLLFFGIIMVYDVSVVFANDVFGGKYYFFLLQSAWASFGILGLTFGSRINLQKLQKFALPLFLISLVFLLFVLLPSPFSPVIYGARRWIYLNPSPFPSLPWFGRLGFQPSEFVKLTFILYLAAVLSKKSKLKVLHFALLIGLVIGLVLMQPDFGTAMLISGIGVLMYFASGANILYFLFGLPASFLLGLFFVLISPYRRERLLTYLSSGFSDPQGASYHINQILIALGSGGLFGLGFGESRQKYQYIPEVATDSIFAVIGEELGFVGLMLLILSFVFIIYRGYRIASKTHDSFERMLAFGVTSWFAVQCTVNLSAMVHLIPLTGVPLPLISYGGSSMIFGLTGLGFLLNVSKNRI